MNIKTKILLVFIVLFMAGCSDKVNTQDIEDNLQLIVSDKQSMASSNPNDYIKSQSKAYQAILNRGNAALEYLTMELRNHKANGLKEWIMAKASDDILGDASPVSEWATGKEWSDKYQASKLE